MVAAWMTDRPGRTARRIRGALHGIAWVPNLVVRDQVGMRVEHRNWVGIHGKLEDDGVPDASAEHMAGFQVDELAG